MDWMFIISNPVMTFQSLSDFDQIRVKETIKMRNQTLHHQRYPHKHLTWPQIE